MTDRLVDRRGHGFYIVDNDIIEVHGRKLGVYGIAVYNVLLKFCNASGTNAFPSYQTIADLIGISRTKAIETVALLLKCGLIEKTSRKSSSGESSSNLYTLLDVKKTAGGSAQDEPPSTPRALPSAQDEPPPSTPHALGSAPHAPDQYPMINTQSLEQDVLIKDIPAAQEKILTQHQEMFGAICEALGCDYRILNKRSKSEIGDAATSLRKAGYSIEDVRAFMIDIWFKSWKWTDKEQYPTLKQLCEGLGQLRSVVKDVAPKKEKAGIEGFREVARRNGIKL